MIIRDVNENDFNIMKKLIGQLSVVSDYSKEQFKNFLDKNNKKIFIFEMNNNIIGTGSLILESKISHDFKNVAHLEDIVVDKNFRGKGYGKYIINYLIQYAKKNNCYKVILNTDEKNLKFYEKCGFKKTNLEMGIYF
jgi:glucosamine-phosphate N-acetyltransferase